jgi:hypothetical protein
VVLLDAIAAVSINKNVHPVILFSVFSLRYLYVLGASALSTSNQFFYRSGAEGSRGSAEKTKRLTTESSHALLPYRTFTSKTYDKRG